MSSIRFEELPLAEPIQRALRDEAYTHPTPIQARSIPPQLEGRDIMGCAQTGTGKTAAFALPILHHLSLQKRRPVRGGARVLVLTPTRELALQVGASFTTYGRHLRLSHALVYGGVSQHPQTRKLAGGVDILVATPGRLIDLMDQGRLSLDQVEFLVLDEVDRMLDMGFIHDVRKIARTLPRQRQTALFSATLNKEVESVASAFVNDPVRISVTPDRPVVANINQEICFVRQENKLALLQGYLRGQGDRNGRHATIVFCRTKYGAEKIARKLNQHGFACDAIHGDKTQKARQRALSGFREGRLPVLIATDVAARGIDVPAISLVINFDMPEAADSYVHRIGRTARADASGNAVSFCTGKDVGLLGQIEKFIGHKVEVDSRHPFHDAEAAAHSTHHGRRPKPRHKGHFTRRKKTRRTGR
jgi:ATP-dependent RNA helicase RhlE